MEKSLQASEWILVGTLVIIIVFLTILAKINAALVDSLIKGQELLGEQVLAEGDEIFVYVRGAVSEPVCLTLPSGSRICDIQAKISLTPEADQSFFRGRKKLSDEEIIEVPKKTVE